MSTADFSPSSVMDPSMQAWPEAGLVPHGTFLKGDEVGVIDNQPQAKSQALGILSRIQKFSADDTIKIMKFARATLLVLGETLWRFGISNVGAQVVGLYNGKGVTKGFAGLINDAKKVGEVFIDTGGAKGLGRVFDNSSSGGFMASVKSGAQPKPFDNPVTFKEKLANIKHGRRHVEEFSKTIMAWHNIFKAPMWVSGVVSSVAKLAGSALASSAKMLASAAVGIDLFDALAFNLPGHIVLMTYHTAVTFDMAKEGFMQGFYLAENKTTGESIKNAFKGLWSNITQREMIDSHILPNARFAAQTGLIVGLGLARTFTAGPAFLVRMAAPFSKFAMSWMPALGCIFTEATIGAYRAWIKTAPKEEISLSKQLALNTPNYLELPMPNAAGKMIFAA